MWTERANICLIAISGFLQKLSCFSDSAKMETKILSFCKGDPDLSTKDKNYAKTLIYGGVGMQQLFFDATICFHLQEEYHNSIVSFLACKIRHFYVKFL